MNLYFFRPRNTYFTFVTILLLGFIFTFTGETNAASAVAFDSNTTAYGFSYNQQTLASAQFNALDRCRSRGGTNCRIIVSCTAGGYGMIYYRRLPGQRMTAIGASCGAPTVDDANLVAKNSCNNQRQGACAGPRASWFDNVGVRTTTSAVFPNLASRGEPIRWDTSLVNTLKFNNAQNPGQTFTLFCPSRGYLMNAYGSNTYHISSSVCTAAVHRGVITTNGGTVRIRIVRGPAVFEGSTRNGVRTYTSQPPDPRWRLGFVFI